MVFRLGDVRSEREEKLLGDLLSKLGNPADPTVIALLDIDVLLRTLLNTPLARLAIDSAGRLRIIIDAAGTSTPVTATASQSGVWSAPTYSVGSEVFQRSNIEYAECQRNKFSFT